MAQPIKIRDDDILFTADDLVDAEFDPSVRALATGRFLITFTEEEAPGDLNATHVSLSFGGSGGGNRIAQQTTVDEQHASGAGFANGTMQAFAWAEKVDSSGEFNIFARVMTASGVEILPRFAVNIGATAGVQDRPEIVTLGDDVFAVSWINRATGKIDYAVYDIAGTTVVAPAALSVSNAVQSFGAPSTARISMAALNSAFFVVAYRSDDFNAKFRIASKFPGLPLGAEIDVDGLSGSNGGTSLAAFSDGNFVMVFQTTTGIKGRVFDDEGTALTAVFNISASAVTNDPPQVAVLDDGRFMVAYSEANDIFARVLNPDGTPDSDAFRVNTVTSGIQGRPDISTQAGGTVVIAWETNEGGSLDIKYTVFDPREGPVFLTGTGTSDDLVGTQFNDTLAGGTGQDVLTGRGGDDTLVGGAGPDSMTGGPGNDHYFVDSLSDFVTENAGEGSGDEVVTKISFSLTADVANVENLTADPSTGPVALNLTGNEVANRIVGNAGANVLDGLAGADLLIGLGGDDTFIVDNTRDVVTEAAGGGTDTVRSHLSIILGANVERAQLLGSAIANATGNTLGNLLTGNSAANLLDGGLASDHMRGSGGNDIYVVDSAGDVVNEALAGSTGNDTVKSSISFNLADAAHVLGDVEDLTLLGTGNINGTGNGLSQRINGNSGNNVLFGFGGGDLLVGYGGNDNLEGGFGIDTLKGVSGADKFVFRQNQIATSGADHIGDFGSDDFVFFDVTSGPTGAIAPGAFRAGPDALDADDRFLYQAATGNLFFDADGNGATAKTLFAVLDNKFALAAADIMLF